jgi:hypothetical protein
MGGAGAGWEYNAGIPLCHWHHDALDARGPNWKTHIEVQSIVEKLAPPFWEKVRREHEPRK